MDSLLTESRPESDERFDSARIAAAVDALAEKHAGTEDAFRSATAQFLKAELMAARNVAQAVLLKDRHGPSALHDDHARVQLQQLDCQCPDHVGIGNAPAFIDANVAALPPA